MTYNMYLFNSYLGYWGHRDRMVAMQSVSITTKVVSSNPVHCQVYSIQHHVIKFVSDLRQVGVFLLVVLFPPQIKLTAMI